MPLCADVAEERAVPLIRKPAELPPDEQLQEQRRDQRMRRDERQGDEEDRPVEGRARPRGEERAQRKDERHEQEHAAQDERSGHRRRPEHDPGDRLAHDSLVGLVHGSRPGDPEVSARQVTDEVAVLHERGPIDAEAVIRLLDLLAGRVLDIAENEDARVLRDGVVDPERQRGEPEQQHGADRQLPASEREHAVHRGRSVPNTRCSASPISWSATTAMKIARLAKIVGQSETAAGR